MSRKPETTLAAPIELACFNCTAAGYFATVEKASEHGWIEIVEAVDDGDMFAWSTHIGYCLNCTEEVVEPSQRNLF